MGQSIDLIGMESNKQLELQSFVSVMVFIEILDHHM